MNDEEKSLPSHLADSFSDLVVAESFEIPLRTSQQRLEALTCCMIAGQLAAHAKENPLTLTDISRFVEHHQERFIVAGDFDVSERRRVYPMFEGIKKMLENAFTRTIDETEPDRVGNRGRG